MTFDEVKPFLMARFLINYKGCDVHDGFKRKADDVFYVQQVPKLGKQEYRHSSLHEFMYGIHRDSKYNWFIPDVPDVRKLTPDQSKRLIDEGYNELTFVIEGKEIEISLMPTEGPGMKWGEVEPFYKAGFVVRLKGSLIGHYFRDNLFWTCENFQHFARWEDSYIQDNFNSSDWVIDDVPDVRKITPEQSKRLIDAGYNSLKFVIEGKKIEMSLDYDIITWNGEIIGYNRPMGSPAPKGASNNGESLTPDMVNHPPHYKSNAICSHCGKSIECIDVTRHLNFNVGNAIKYLWRVDKKTNALEDLRKAAWYINNEIDKRGG